ncbi:F0F1 ATP synthase subunit B [Synechococcus sp. O70.1]|uniref:F0F1 ATP synthase subunit B n=1 Tax=Synechococcus sp. O70.1 TaxID=2964535 RepID=UPI0039C4640A
MLGFSWMPAWLLAVAEPGILEAVLESNLINIAIILTLLYLLGRRVVGEALAKRRESILEELRQAEQRKQEALERLAKEQQKLAQAQQEAERIRRQAEASAEARRQEMLQQVEQEIERLRAKAARDLAAEQEQILQELRRQIVRQALRKVEQELPQHLNEQIHHRLIEQGIQMLAR